MSVLTRNSINHRQASIRPRDREVRHGKDLLLLLPMATRHQWKEALQRPLLVRNLQWPGCAVVQEESDFLFICLTMKTYSGGCLKSHGQKSQAGKGRESHFHTLSNNKQLYTLPCPASQKLGKKNRGISIS